MQDSIFTIREAAIENLKELAKIFGAFWASRFAVPKLVALHTDANYLHRQTPLFGMTALAPVINADIVRRQFVPVLITLSQDRVANIRMNVSKSIQALLPVIAQQAQENRDIIVSTHT